MEVKVTDSMYNNSLVNRGNINRILKMIKKAEKGKDIKIVFLGGSITQGCNSTSYDKCYVELTYKWFKDKFKNVNVSHVNAGVGATGSLIGVHRVKTQVIDEKPDLVFVDFAVNDLNEDYCRQAYESLIRRLLNSESKPAVIELFMTKDDGSNVQEQQINIGQYYDIPMISYRNAVYDEILKGRLKWSDIITDEVHPNDNGHKIISELIIRYFNDILSGKNEEGCIEEDINNKKCIYSERYINGVILNDSNIITLNKEGFDNFKEGFQVFKNGWKTNKDKSKLSVRIKARNICLLYEKLISDDAGSFIIKVDGKNIKTINALFDNGWGNYSETEILILDDNIKEHTIEIETISGQVNILGFLIS